MLVLILILGGCGKGVGGQQAWLELSSNKTKIKIKKVHCC
jgi:hypothetical protein